MTEKLINIQLTERQVHVMLNLLGSAPMPYKESAPLIKAVSDALQNHGMRQGEKAEGQSATQTGSADTGVARDPDASPEVVEEGGAGFPLPDGPREHTN